MKKLLGIAAVTLMLMLTGCGGGDDNNSSQGSSTDTTTPTTEATTSTDSTTSAAASSAYCDALKNAKQNLASINLGQLDEESYKTLTSELSTVSDAAPSDLQDDWQAEISSLDNVHKLLASAGLDFNDVTALSTGQLPKGVTQKQLKALGKQVQTILSDNRLQEASQAISKSAQDCGLSLN